MSLLIECLGCGREVDAARVAAFCPSCEERLQEPNELLSDLPFKAATGPHVCQLQTKLPTVTCPYCRGDVDGCTWNEPRCSAGVASREADEDEALLAEEGWGAARCQAAPPLVAGGQGRDGGEVSAAAAYWAVCVALAVVVAAMVLAVMHARGER